MLSAQGKGAKDYMHSRDVLLLLVTTDIIKLSKSQNISIFYSLVSSYEETNRLKFNFKT